MSGPKLDAMHRGGAAPDRAILERVAAGDPGALGALYDRYAPGLMRFARKLDPNDAEDIIQTVFLRVLRLAAGFDPSHVSARPWLFAITVRVTQERRRALRRWTAAKLRLRDERARSVPPTRDTRLDIERGLAKLSVAKRTVLLLSEVEGFSCPEIAAMLEVPVGTIWTRLHHARRELRALSEGGEP